jgi:hypothetical protein
MAAEFQFFCVQQVVISLSNPLIYAEGVGKLQPRPGSPRGQPA